ncbi:hypothetical protein ES702_01173 [subsurface metagenome]
MPKRKKRKVKKSKKTKHYGAKFKAPEFIYYKKGAGWYVGVVLIAIILAGLFLWLKMWLLAGVVALAAIVAIQYATVMPKKFEVHIKTDQIEIKEKTYPISHFKSFWIVFDQPTSTLYLETTRKLIPWMSVHISAKEAVRVRKRLLNFLPEKKTASEDLFIKLNRWFRF